MAWAPEPTWSFSLQRWRLERPQILKAIFSNISYISCPCSPPSQDPTGPLHLPIQMEKTSMVRSSSLAAQQGAPSSCCWSVSHPKSCHRRGR